MLKETIKDSEEGEAMDNTITLETGEQREGKVASSRLFFVYVSPTGAEISIHKAPSLKRVFSRPTGGFEGSSRLVNAEFEVKGPTRIKMVNNHTRLGKPTIYVNLYLNVGGKHSLIDMTGLQDFGRFRGRAEIDIAGSTITTRDRKRVKLTPDTLKKYFGLRILQAPPDAGQDSDVRSLIF
jgi:hypothetical protein